MSANPLLVGEELFSEASANATTRKQQGSGKRLKDAREYLGLSYDDVANHLKISKADVIGIESGDGKPDARDLAKLAKLYQTHISWLATSLVDSTKSFSEDFTKPGLSHHDRLQLERFATFLKSRARLRASGDGR